MAESKEGCYWKPRLLYKCTTQKYYYGEQGGMLLEASGNLVTHRTGTTWDALLGCCVTVLLPFRITACITVLLYYSVAVLLYHCIAVLL